VQIELYALGEHPFARLDILKMIRDRDCELTLGDALQASGIEPLYGVYALPMFMPVDFEDIDGIHTATRDEVLKPVLDRWNTDVLLSYFMPSSRIDCNVKVVDENSLHGQKIGAWSAEMVEVVNLVGGTGLAMNWGEVPTALATKVIDGYTTSAGSAYDGGLWDHLKYMNCWEIVSPDGHITINRDALNELEPDVRDAFMKVFSDWEPKFKTGNMVDAWIKTTRACTDYGVEILAPPKAFRDEVRTRVEEEIWPSWIDRAGSDGERAFNIVNEAIKKQQAAKN